MLQNMTVKTKRGYRVNKNSLDVLVSYHRRSKKTGWIYDRMDEFFFRAVRRFRFDVKGTTEPLKYLVYNKGQHINRWHTDSRLYEPAASKLTRKLSMSIELSPRGSFEGGKLEVFQSGPPLNARQGWAVVFPSHVPHRLIPVTQGVRHVLVNFFSGPPFR